MIVMSHKRNNPWLSFLKYPDKTVKRLVSAKNYKDINHITALVGIYFAVLSISIMKYLGIITKSRLLAILLACIIGAVGGYLYIYVGGYYLALIGRLFRGSAKSKQVRLAIAWSSLPKIIAIPFLLPATFLELFHGYSFKPMFIIGFSFFTLICNSISQVLHAVSLGYLIRTLASVHHFSGWKSFFTISIGAITIAVPAFLIYLIFN
jgi:hypothetical protein